MSNSFLDKIEVIAKELKPLWDSESDENTLAQKSLDIVSKHKPETEFNEKELYSYLLSQKNLKSEYPPGSFSDFNLTIHHDDKFRIDIYCWSKMQTGIHSHPFYGCFYLLAGKTIQNRYSFTNSSGDNDITIGELALVGTDHLAAGSGQAILIDEHLIHNTYYMVNPTISFVVRSVTSETINNYNYRYPSLRFKKDPLNTDEKKLLELYSYLFCNVKDNKSSLDEIIAQFTEAKRIFIFFDRSDVLKLMKQEAGEFFLKSLAGSVKSYELDKIWLQHDQFLRKTNFILPQK